MNKISALQKTIYNLENDVYEYSWSSCDSCNCGILARTLMGGKLPYEGGLLKSPYIREGGPFSRYAACMKTNLPLPEVFQALKDAGFSHKEMIELESLGNLFILNKLGRTYFKLNDGRIIGSGFDGKYGVVEYLKAWVEVLQEEEETKTHVDETSKFTSLIPIVDEVSDVKVKFQTT